MRMIQTEDLNQVSGGNGFFDPIFNDPIYSAKVNAFAGQYFLLLVQGKHFDPALFATWNLTDSEISLGTELAYQKYIWELKDLYKW